MLLAGLEPEPSAVADADADQATELSSAKPGRRVVLIGASIGREWDLPDFAVRMNLRGYSFEALQAWQYDKSDLIAETLMRPSRKFRLTPGYVKGFFRPAPQPADMIILKECSSYFPGDMHRQKKLMHEWTREIRRKNVAVMLATVVPVTRARARRDPGKQEGIREFNDWLREFAPRQDLPLLDLERALRADDTERYLRDEFTNGDGSHLNREAYRILDRLLLRTVSIQTAGH